MSKPHLFWPRELNFERKVDARNYLEASKGEAKRQKVWSCLDCRLPQVNRYSNVDLGEIHALLDGARTDDEDIHQPSGAWLPVGRGRNIRNAD